MFVFDAQFFCHIERSRDAFKTNCIFFEANPAICCNLFRKNLFSNH